MSLGELVVDQMIRKETRRFIEYAQGTCQSISEVLDVLDIPDESYINWKTVDDEIFHCESCSWWCEISEQDENGDCQDCSTITECQKCYGMFELNDMIGELCQDCYDEDGD